MKYRIYGRFTGNTGDKSESNLNSRNLRIVGMTNHTHNKYKTVMEMMLRHKDTFPWERLFSHHFPLAEQAVKAGMTRESMKVVIDPWME
mgnify:CR=1 FL=1